MENLETYYNLVEECIGKLGVDAASCRGEKPGQWSLKKGSVNVWIDVFHLEKEGRAYFQVMSPVMKVPTQNKGGLFEELLTINDRLFGVAFTLYKETVWLKVIREVQGMDVNEAFAMITRIGNYADQYDDELKAKYPSSAPPGGDFGPGSPPQM